MSSLIAPSPSENPSNGASNPLIVICVVIANALIILIVFFLFFCWKCKNEAVSDEAIHNSSSTNSTPCSSPRTSGVKTEDLSFIPQFVHEGTDVEEKKECAVCMTDFVDGQIGRVLPACQHKFHIECIDTWLKNHGTCPVCRRNIKESKAEEEEEKIYLDV